MGGAAFGGGDPGPQLPRWIVTHVLRVAALEVGDPVTFLVQVVTHDRLLHR